MKKMSGFSLIEVLVVAAIVLIGVTGYVTLQSDYIRSDATLNLRQVAVELAQEKLDDLRQFNSLESANNVIAYNDIVNNVGGTIDAGDVNIPIKANDGEVYQFTRAWTVIDQYFVDTNNDGSPDTWLNEGDINLPNNLPSVATQKAINVVVNYTDKEGQEKQVILGGSIAPVPVGRSFQASNETDNAKSQPEVPYTPGQAPDVISYELGNGEKIETSKPVPDIDNRGDNNVVKFDTIRYLESDDDVDRLEQEEFLTVNCECKLQGVAEGYSASMTVLDGDQLVVEEGKPMMKMTGAPANNQQPNLCTKCCRDHHDTSLTVANENYYRVEAGLPHKHYFRQNNGTFTLAISSGDSYHEACRFKRVNGFFQLYPDWHLVDIVNFDDQYLFSESNLENYKDYTENLIQAEIKNSTRPVRPSDRNLLVPPGGFQMISRGIYLDPMKTEHLNKIKEKISNGDSDWKAITPFYDVNLTLLSNWDTSDQNIATVTNQDIQTIVDPVNNYYGTYSRGRLEALADGIATVKVDAFKYNGSIVGTGPVSPIENTSVIADYDVKVEVDSKSEAEKFFGLIADVNCLITIGNKTDPCETNNKKRNTYVDLSTLSVMPDPGNFNCLVNVPKGKSTPFFSCENVSENWKGKLKLSLFKNGYTTVIKVGYPDGSVVKSNELQLQNELVATSNREYSIIIELYAN